MKILEVKDLALPEVKVIRFARFHDHRGYFAESFRRSDFQNRPELSFLQNVEYFQCNESYSQKGKPRLGFDCGEIFNRYSGVSFQELKPSIRIKWALA